MKRLSALLIVCLVLIVGRFYLREGFPYTHDGENHLARFANYKVAIKEGQFPPRFAPNLFNHYGYPVFNYNYPLANIVSVPFSAIGVEYETTFKLLALSFLVFGSFGVAAALRRLQVDWRGAILVSVFVWLTAPYILQLLYVRGSIGEVAALSLIPWLIWTIERRCGDKQLPGWHWIQDFVIWAAFFLSHNSSVLFVTPVVLGIGGLRLWTNGVRLSAAKTLALAITLAILSSLWFWLPALVEQTATLVGSAANQREWSRHFTTVSQLLYAPPSFGFSYPGTVDSLGLGMGVSLVLGLVIAISRLLAAATRLTQGASQIRRLLSPLAVYVGSTLLLLFAQLEASRALWELFPPLRFVQFPWRLSILATTTGVISLSLAIAQLPRKAQWLVVAIVVTLGMQAMQLRPVDYFHKHTIDYDLFSQSTSTQNENRSVSFTYTNVGDWQPAPSVAAGQATTQVRHWTGTQREYDVTVSEQATLIEPTMFFPGWQTSVTSDAGIKRQISYTDSLDIGGRIAYVLEPGVYRVHTSFTQRTPARLVGNAVSLITVVGVCLWTAATYYRHSLGKRHAIKK